MVFFPSQCKEGYGTTQPNRRNGRVICRGLSLPCPYPLCFTDWLSGSEITGNALQSLLNHSTQLISVTRARFVGLIFPSFPFCLFTTAVGWLAFSWNYEVQRDLPRQPGDKDLAAQPRWVDSISEDVLVHINRSWQRHLSLRPFKSLDPGARTPVHKYTQMAET